MRSGFSNTLDNSLSLKTGFLQTMKRLLAMLALALMLWGVSFAPAEAAIPDDVQKLLDTKKCQVCILNDADLNHTDLHGANLKIAVLTGANLVGADLSETNLMLSDMEGANLSGAILTNAQMNGANLPGANLTGADLSNAEMTQANLDNADLSNANLSGAVMLSVTLGTANLKGANLTGANLRGTNRSLVLFCNTTMPDGAIENRDC